MRMYNIYTMFCMRQVTGAAAIQWITVLASNSKSVVASWDMTEEFSIFTFNLI